MQNTQFIEPRNGSLDRVGAVIDVVGDADNVNTCTLERLAARGGRRIEGLVVIRAAAGRIVQAAFEIAEDDVGSLEHLLEMLEGNAGIGHTQQIDVTGKNHA